MPQIHRLYVPEFTQDLEEILIKGDQAKVLTQVLRLQAGDEVTLLNGSGLIATSCIDAIIGREVRLSNVQASLAPTNTPRVAISVGALKKDKSALVVQKLTEIGVADISFFESQYAIAKIDPGKQTKYERTATEAMRQSGNPYRPEISLHKTLDACLQSQQQAVVKICLHEKEKGKGLSSCYAPAAASYHVVVGPEGGFSDDELEKMRVSGYVVAGCAPYVLRAETAAIYSAAFIQASGS